MLLTKACKELLIKSPFYGLFLLNLNKEVVNDEHQIKTIGVGPNGVNFTLYVNNNFWNSLTNNEQLAVLQHELMHICFFHLTKNFDTPDPEIMNTAMDIEINQYIQNLPSCAVTLEKISSVIGELLEPKKGSWYYYNKLHQHNNKSQNLLTLVTDKFTNIDDHKLWPKNITEAERILYENQIKVKLKEVSEIISKQAGNIPGELKEILESISIKPPIFNWKKYFRRLVGNTITNDILLTRMRPSKRVPDSRGIKIKRKPNICVIVDTSGSISEADFKDFFSEINYIYKSGVSVTVIECDTKINNIFEFKGLNNIKISGRGGTILTPAVDYYKDHPDFSSCVLFTDGFLGDNPFPTAKNLIWVIASNGNKTQKYKGYTIFIP